MDLRETRNNILYVCNPSMMNKCENRFVTIDNDNELNSKMHKKLLYSNNTTENLYDHTIAQPVRVPLQTTCLDVSICRSLDEIGARLQTISEGSLMLVHVNKRRHQYTLATGDND